MSSELRVDAKILDKIFAGHPGRMIAKNRPLLYQGEVPTMAFYIKSGIVKIFNITSQGEEKIVGYESDGSLLPLAWLFNRAPVSLYYYDTFTDCEIIRVPREELIETINSNHEVALALLDRNISMYIGATMHLHALEQSKARQKLLSIMQYLVLRFGNNPKGRKQKIGLHLTHQEIANLIGTTRETTSTEISKLTKEGVVSLNDGHYVIDIDKAVRLLGEEDFKEISL